MSLLKRWYTSLSWQKQFLPSQLHKPWFKLIKPDTCLCKIIWLLSASREKYKLWSEQILIWYCDVWVLIPKHLPTAKSSFHLNKSPKIHSDWTAEKTFLWNKWHIYFFLFLSSQRNCFHIPASFLEGNQLQLHRRVAGEACRGKKRKGVTAEQITFQ